MLHLFTQSTATNLTQRSSLALSLTTGANLSPLIFPTQQQINQPVAGFCFQYLLLLKKMYFMLRCNHTIAKNVGVELAT